MNHAPTRAIKQMTRGGCVLTMPKHLAEATTRITCSACATAKQRPATPRKSTHNYAMGHYISSDTCVPINSISTHGHSHFLTYIDAGSRYLIIYFLQDRREVGLIMKQHMSKLHNANRTLQYFCTGNALEFKSKTALKTYADSA